MKMEIVNIIVIAFSAVIYILTAIYQRKKISNLENLINSQSSIITDFEKYKSLFDVDDFEKRLKIKLDTQQSELKRDFNKHLKQVMNKAIQEVGENFLSENKEMHIAWEELQSIVVGITLGEFPESKDKVERDQHIKKYYPLNSKYLIPFIDAIQNGNVRPKST